MSRHILGIRHHGPGSARNVKAFLEEIGPDLVLVEGPPEGDALLQGASHPELKPPVAILCYQPDDPQHSVFYPFAEFSPEWQAIQYARKNNLSVRFFDLPVAQQLALEKETSTSGENKADGAEPAGLNHNANAESPEEEIKSDPIAYLAEAAGYEEGEKWWEHMFEHRRNNEQVFGAVAEAMQALRSHLHAKEDRLEKLREAHMRKTIREAEQEGYQNIAVVCGAWHVPALLNGPAEKEDNALLKGLPKVKVACTWVPWSYSRLSYYSGYGAGIHSPGWYEHIWRYPADDGTRWMAKVAGLFRKNGMDTSVAHVIEAVRLAESLASLRGLSKAGLEEMNEATWSVLCNGESILMQLIHDQLIVSNTLGEVPAGIPRPPLQVDLEKLQKTLRLPATADFRDYVLDLRKETDLQRSILLHRLELLEIRWGTPQGVSGKGTFKEQWRLQWDPAFSIDLIEKGIWGNTVEDAADHFVLHQARESASLQVVSGLLEKALPAELNKAVDTLIEQINNLSAASGDVVQLMEVIPSLVSVSRYGSVRKTNADLVLNIATSMIARVCVSLPNAVTGIDEEAAQHLSVLFFNLNEAVNLLQQADVTGSWQQTLRLVAYGKNTAPLIGGYAIRLLTDYRLLEGDELITVFNYHMSAANAPAVSAAWLEGFLKGSGTILLLDEGLWNVVNNWLASLEEPHFSEVLPLLRRTFANFPAPERRKLGEKARSGTKNTAVSGRPAAPFDYERAAEGVPVVLQLLGLRQARENA